MTQTTNQATKATYRYMGQSDDVERGQLFADLQAQPHVYLVHPDGAVRSAADWTLEYYGVRRLRPDLIPTRDIFPHNVHYAWEALNRLYVAVRRVPAAEVAR